MNMQIGKPVSRLEGELKVTGAAKYAGEYEVKDLLYGYVINATIPKGKITRIDVDSAKAIDGVIEVFSHENRPSLAWFDINYSDMDAPPGSPFRPLHKADVKYYGQPVGLVVAETFELARYAATLVEIDYEADDFETDLYANLHQAREPKTGMASMLRASTPKPKGNVDEAWNTAFAKVAARVVHGTEHHNPIELFTTTTVYEGKGKLTIYDKTQGTVNSQLYVANVFGLHFKNVRVIAPYVGGAFGSGLRPQYQLFMSAMAALELKRNVRVTLDRDQMFSFGHRPPTVQDFRFSANSQGRIQSLEHVVYGETSRYEDYIESVVNWSNMMYSSPNRRMDYKLVPLDVFTPLDMRAPGGSTAIHGIESMIDQLAYEAKIDPLEFRIVNYAERDEAMDKPFSSKELRACYEQGAEKFGWSKRLPEPRSMRRGNKLVGYGVATGAWEVMIIPAKAEIVLTAEGKILVSSAVTDIGTGTLTVMTQIAADEFGLPLEDVRFSYGDSKLPFAPIQGGSWTVSVVGSAIRATAKALRKKLFKIAASIDGSPFLGSKLDEVVFANATIYLKADPSKFLLLTDLVIANKNKPIKASKTNIPNLLKLRKYTRAAHSAAFIEVEVDEELGVINVTRALTAVAAGKIVNPKTAKSQILGGMVWGISKALREETISDHRYGKYINTNIAEYHIPVHADIHELDVIFVEEDDKIVNELGSKGVGEIGIVAMAPAITNAIYHATGKRINHLPIHFDELL